MDRVLIRYCRALDQVDFEVAFLKLWGVLETLTGSNKIDEIAARVAFRYDDYHFAKQTVKYLRSYRNLSVHSGETLPEMEGYALRIKRIVESMILFHLKHRIGYGSMSAVADEVLSLSHDPDQLREEIVSLQEQIEARKFAINYHEPP